MATATATHAAAPHTKHQLDTTNGMEPTTVSNGHGKADAAEDRPELHDHEQPLYLGSNARAHSLSAAIDVVYSEQLGALVLRERPYVYSVFDECAAHFCGLCLKAVDDSPVTCEHCASEDEQLVYCSEACRAEDYSQRHRYECGALRSLLKGVGLRLLAAADCVDDDGRVLGLECLLLALRVIMRAPLPALLQAHAPQLLADAEDKHNDDDIVNDDDTDLLQDEPHGAFSWHSFNDEHSLYRSFTHLLPLQYDTDLEENQILVDLASVLASALLFANDADENSIKYCSKSRNSFLHHPDWPPHVTTRQKKMCTEWQLDEERPSIEQVMFEVLEAAIEASLKRMPRNKQAVYEYEQHEGEGAIEVALDNNQGHKAVAIYPTHCFCNHSCLPNSHAITGEHGIMEVRAITDIAVGESIYNCYGYKQGKDGREQRQALLAQQYLFECECDACTDAFYILVDAEMDAFFCAHCATCLNSRRDQHCRSCEADVEEMYDELKAELKRFRKWTREFSLANDDERPIDLVKRFATVRRHFHPNNRTLNATRMELAEKLLRWNQFRLAEVLLTECRAVVVRQCGDNSLKRATVMMKQAELHAEADQWHKADKMRRQICQLYLLHFGIYRARRLLAQTGQEHYSQQFEDEARAHANNHKQLASSKDKSTT